MAIVTLSELRQQVRERSDMVYSQFVSDAEITRYLNQSLAKLWDLLVQANVDYYNTTETFSISSGTNTHTLPADFYKIRGLDSDLGGRWLPVWPYNFAERGYWQDAVISRICSSVSYRVTNNTLEFLPDTQASGNYRLIYVPLFTPLSDDDDTFDGHNGYEVYAIIDAAIKCRDKEESSITVLKDSKDEEKKRILAMSEVRDYGATQQVANIRAYNGGSSYDY